MITALAAGQHAFATPRARATCPDCDETVIARVGEVVRAHWAHQPGSDCTWATAPETEWHANWKLLCTDPARVEVTRGPHRADTVSPSGLAIEFQHSNISALDVRNREQHWRRGVWVWDGQAAAWYPDDDWTPARLELRAHPDRRNESYRTFLWRWTPHIISAAKWPIWVDIGENEVFLVGRIYPDRSPKGGYGWVLHRDVFVAGLINGWGLSPSGPSFGQDWRPEPLTEKPEHTTPEVRPVTQDNHAGPTLNWRDHQVGKPRPCRICDQPAMMRDEHGRPCHKVCVEEPAVPTGAGT